MATVVPPIYIGRKISTSKGQNRLANVKNLTTLDILWHDPESTFQQNKNNLFKYTENGEKIFSCQPTNIVEVWYEHRIDLHTGIMSKIQFNFCRYPPNSILVIFNKILNTCRM